MKIIFDKTHEGPNHALTAKNVKRLFSLLPDEWTDPIKTIHFSSNLNDKSNCNRKVILYSTESRLNVVSRGYSEIETIKNILMELAYYAVGKHPNNRLSNRFRENFGTKEQRYLEEMIEPYMDQYGNET